jgi:hypothetical protein
MARGRTVREIEELTLSAPPRYRLGKKSFYTIILDLGKDPRIPMELNPYLFSLSF